MNQLYIYINGTCSIAMLNYQRVNTVAFFFPMVPSFIQFSKSHWTQLASQSLKRDLSDALMFRETHKARGSALPGTSQRTESQLFLSLAGLRGWAQMGKPHRQAAPSRDPAVCALRRARWDIDVKRLVWKANHLSLPFPAELINFL